jgi:predicted nucleotidyltransferase
MNRTYRELLLLFTKHRVRYLVVGAYAVMHYTEPPFTKNLDLFVDRTPKNAARVYRALVEFGAPLADYTPADFTTHYAVFQIGVEPVRVDVIMHLPGVRVPTAWEHRKTTTAMDGARVHFISKADLIRAKKAAGRRRDLDDIDALEGRS